MAALAGPANGLDATEVMQTISAVATAMVSGDGTALGELIGEAAVDTLLEAGLELAFRGRFNALGDALGPKRGGRHSGQSTGPGPGSTPTGGGPSNVTPAGAASGRARFEVTPDGDVIPTQSEDLLPVLSELAETSTNPASSRKFVGADERGPVRVRIERAHPNDPEYTGLPDPLHVVDHLHIDRKRNGATGGWQSNWKIQLDWPFGILGAED